MKHERKCEKRGAHNSRQDCLLNCSVKMQEIGDSIETQEEEEEEEEVSLRVKK